jgi:hypothetical protein
VVDSVRRCNKLAWNTSVGSVYVRRSSEGTKPKDILYQKDTQSLSVWLVAFTSINGVHLSTPRTRTRQLTVSICRHLVLEVNTIQVKSFILLVCLHVISRLLTVEFQRMCSCEMTEGAALYCFQNNLFIQAGKAGSKPMANTICERERWSLPTVAVPLPL